MLKIQKNSVQKVESSTFIAEIGPVNATTPFLQTDNLEIKNNKGKRQIHLKNMRKKYMYSDM